MNIYVLVASQIFLRASLSGDRCRCKTLCYAFVAQAVRRSPPTAGVPSSRLGPSMCGFRGGRNGVWVGFSRGFSRFPLPQILFHLFSTLISSISFHFIRPCDGASDVVGRHPCYSRTYNMGASSHLIPRPDLVLDTSWGYLFMLKQWRIQANIRFRNISSLVYGFMKRIELAKRMKKSEKTFFFVSIKQLPVKPISKKPRPHNVRQLAVILLKRKSLNYSDGFCWTTEEKDHPYLQNDHSRNAQAGKQMDMPANSPMCVKCKQ